MALGVAVGVTLGVAAGVGVGVTVGAGDGVGVESLYSSALALMVGKPIPPTASTIPSGSNVAVCRALALLRVLVTFQAPLAGSYSSAFAKAKPLESNPPATSVIPLDNKLAVSPERPVLRLPVALVLRESPLVVSTVLIVLNARAK